MAASWNEVKTEPFIGLKHARSAEGSAATFYSVVCSNSGTIFTWDSTRNCVYGVKADGVLDSRYKPQSKTYICTNPPDFDVRSIIPDDDARHIALVGTGAISILVRPVDNLDRKLCKTIEIDPRYFQSIKRHTILKVLWVPSGYNVPFISVLLSNNTIRTYSIGKPQTPHHIFTLTEQSSKFKSALGESFVSMDYGVHRGNHMTHTVYLLSHAGSVYRATLDLRIKSQNMIELAMHMKPAADDNYGSDACDLINISLTSTNQSTTDVLVIVTASGRLYHCVQLIQEKTGLSAIEDDYSLYLYDQVKIDLFLTNSENLADYEVSTQIRLIKDAENTCSYFCLHSMGLHRVTLSWMHEMNNTEPEEDDDDMELSSSECHHILCTQPVANKEASPIKGFTLLADQSGSNNTILCILNDFTTILLKFRVPVIPETPLFSNFALDEGWKNENKDRFLNSMREILKKSAQMPFVKSNPEQEQSAEENLKLLARTIEVYRGEYIKRMEVARTTLDKRLDFLRVLKGEQLNSLDDLIEQKSELTETAREIAERYEDLSEQNITIVKRAEKVMSIIESRAATPSKAEGEFRLKLKSQEWELSALQESLDDVQRRHRYQQDHSGLGDKEPGFSLSDPQFKSINKILKDESETLQTIIQKIKDLKTVTS